MNRRFLSLIAAALFAAPAISHARTTNEKYEVATWFGFREAALTYTFDDGCANQFAIGIPLFDEFGYKVTLFPVINWTGDKWDKLQSAAANGHEVASHTVSHPVLARIPVDKQQQELENARLEIDKKIPAAKCLTIAYPNCVAGDLSLVAKNYIAARNCQNFIEGPTPKDFLNISSIACGSQSNMKTAADLNNKITDALSSNGWLIYLFHGIDNDGGYSPIPSNELRQNLEYVKKMDAKIWVATFLNVSLYIRERNAVKVQELSSSAEQVTLSVTDTLDNEIYNYPLSLRYDLPDGWKNMEVIQNGKKIPSEIVGEGDSRKVQFNIIPDGGNVLLKRSNKNIR
jgi:oligosaccharide reducing-end xylanase